MFKYWSLMMFAGAALVAPAADMEWMTSVEDAAAKAARHNKMMLVWFTGSDWCKACMYLQKNVLDKPEFVQWVRKNYVPVELNVPMNAALVGGEEQLRQNKKFCDDFGIKIFPSLMIVTPELVFLGGIQGSSSSTQNTIAALSGYQSVVDSYQRAMKLTAEPRARALFEVYKQLPQELQSVNYPLMQLIAEADADNVTGIRESYLPIHQMKELENKLNAAPSFQAKLAVVDAALQQALPANKTAILRQKEMLLKMEVLNLLKNPRSVEDILKARDLSVQAVECSENVQSHAAQKQKVLDYFSNPEALFKARTQSQK